MHYRFDDTLSVAEQMIQELRNHFKTKKLDMHQFFHDVDKDKNNDLNYNEFAQMIKNIFPKIEEKTIRATFAEFDKNNDNTINETEFLTKFNEF